MNFIHPDIENYIQSLNHKTDPQLDLIKERSEKDQIPIVDEAVGYFLHWLVLTYKPKDILEIGFGGGYSTLWMMKALEEERKILSLELNTDRIENGIKLYKEFNLLHRLDLRYKDALEFITETEETFDFIFLDGIKRSYMQYLPRIPRVLRKGGLFIADNILFRGYVVQEQVDKKYEVGRSVLNNFNHTLAQPPFFKTFFLPIGDGLSMSIKITD